MIITRTPFRISFVGGGSDLAAFYEQSAGAVLSTTINKYMYISSHHFFEENTTRVKYSKTEEVQDVTKITHPIFKEVLSSLKIKGVEISSIADVPSGTGMGSSSSFTVGLLHNMNIIKGIHPSKENLASAACDIEINKLQEPIGKQDQYAAAYGGLNVIRFLEDGTVKVEPLLLKPNTLQTLEDNLVMFYMGNQRKASSILSEQKKNTKSKEKFTALKKMVSLVDDLKTTLEVGDLNNFGSLLHENWLLKRELASGVSSPLIDNAYEVALKNGATGGKLLGAGGGGFLLFYCEKKKQAKLKEALGNLRYFDFQFDQDGSKMIYNNIV